MICPLLFESTMNIHKDRKYVLAVLVRCTFVNNNLLKLDELFRLILYKIYKAIQVHLRKLKHDDIDGQTKIIQKYFLITLKALKTFQILLASYQKLYVLKKYFL